MSESPQTFEEARSDWRKEREEEGEEPFFADESPIVPEDASIEEQVEKLRTFLEASPERLTRRRAGDVVKEPRQVVGPIQLRLGELDGILEDLRDDLNDATSSQDFLSNIAQSNLFISERLGIMSTTQVEMLDAIFTLLDYMSPLGQITVSGTNEIEDVDTAEVVVPSSDNTSIPTKTLFVKASPDNQDSIAVGDDEVAPDSGWILNPGDFVILDIDLRNDILWMSSETDDQVVELMGFA